MKGISQSGVVTLLNGLYVRNVFKYFDSDWQKQAGSKLNATITIAHGLGIIPKIVNGYICPTANQQAIIAPDKVNTGGANKYYCAKSHHSGVFANDLAAGDWIQDNSLVGDILWLTGKDYAAAAVFQFNSWHLPGQTIGCYICNIDATNIYIHCGSDYILWDKDKDGFDTQITVGDFYIRIVAMAIG